MHSLLPNVAQSKKHAQQGFSLLELCVVLAVLGILGASSLSVMGARLNSAHEKVTKEHQELALKVLANHALRNHALPCPSADAQGIARPSCLNPSEALGYLPFRTLGISDKIAKDGWGHMMRYGVEPRLTQISPEIGQDLLESLCTQNEGTLQVSRAGQSVLASNSKDLIALVLYSQGTAYPQGQSPSERTNEASSLVFTDMPLSTNPENLHRHMLVWATRDHLFSQHGHFSCAAYVANMRSSHRNLAWQGEQRPLTSPVTEDDFASWGEGEEDPTNPGSF